MIYSGSHRTENHVRGNRMQKIAFIVLLLAIQTHCFANEFDISALVSDPVNSIVSKIVSPDKKHIVYIFERNAGATTSHSTQISLLPSSDPPPNSSGNIFVADTDLGIAHAATWGGPQVQVRWENPTKIEIAYSADSRIFTNKNKLYGVEICFTTLKAEQGAAVNP